MTCIRHSQYATGGLKLPSFIENVQRLDHGFRPKDDLGGMFLAFAHKRLAKCIQALKACVRILAMGHNHVFAEEF